MGKFQMTIEFAKALNGIADLGAWCIAHDGVGAVRYHPSVKRDIETEIALLRSLAIRDSISAEDLETVEYGDIDWDLLCDYARDPYFPEMERLYISYLEVLPLS
jgi:hypothetical protein